MATKLQAKQIQKLFGSFIKIQELTVNGGTHNVTTVITSALTTAGNGGTAVPLLSSTAVTAPGVVVLGDSNRAEIWDNVTKDKVEITGREVYGRITVSVGVYTLTFYYLNDSGVETPYSFAAPTDIDVDFVYRFQFDQLPTDAIVNAGVKNIAQDGANGGGNVFHEVLTVTSTNTVSDTTKVPTPASNAYLIVNGQVLNQLGGSPPFTISTNTVTWSAANAGFSLETTDLVIVGMTTLE